jgi:FixJ family two-component response regulator
MDSDCRTSCHSALRVGDFRSTLELLVRAAGWQAETFASAQEFFARPRSVVPSCLILDVTLPDLNGLELQERIASERTDMPIIFLTGVADIAMTVRAMKRGALEFLTKPFDAEALLIGIQQAITQRGRARPREPIARLANGLWVAYSTGARSDDIGSIRPAEQAGGWRSRHQ